MNRLLSIIEDENGTISMIRVMGVIFMISYVVQWQRAIWVGGAMPELEELIAVLGTFGFKVLQKPFEKLKKPK